MAAVYTVRFYPYKVYDNQHWYTGEKYPYAMLHDPTQPDRFLMDTQLEIAQSRSGNFTFTITKENPLYSRLRQDMQWEVAVFRDSSRCIWAGYPTERSTDIYGKTIFSCEGVLGYLNQVYLPAFSFSGISPSELIRRVVFNWYNTEITPDSGEDTSKSRHKCFANGYIGDFDTDENGKERKITRYTDKSLTAMDILQTRLVDYFGGDLHVKMAAAPEVTDELWELHYQSPDTSNINPHTLEIGKNVVEVDYQYDTQNFYTALVPTDKDNNILVTANNDVQSVTDGHQTITAVRRKNSVIFRNVKLVKTYGLLVGLYQTESEIADSASLIGSTLSKAANLKPPKVSFSVHAKDTTMLTGDAPLEIGQYVQFRHPQRTLHAMMLISKITMKLEDPTQNEIELSGYADGNPLRF